MVIVTVSGSPAAQAGLQPGDVILSLQGVSVTTVKDFVAAVRQLGAAGEMQLAMWRRGEIVSVVAKLGSPVDAQRLSEANTKADALEREIEAYSAILKVFTRDRFPDEWANIQSNLGLAYDDRVRGNRADNLEKAIAAYEAALTGQTPEAMPVDWGRTQHNLGEAYRERIRGDRGDNLEKAIAAYEAALTVRTRQGLPSGWALTQNNLGLALTNRVRGDRADNLERAIAAYEAALTVRTREASPVDWARTQSNLGIAYAQRIRGDRAGNLEKAIAASEAALTVMKREVLPVQSASTEANLAIIYRDRIRGNRAENIEKAIALCEAALGAIERGAQPVLWSTIQESLGSAYWSRIRGDRADNMERAIAAYEAALIVRTREASPFDWAGTQHNLGMAYRDRIRGNRADNIEKTISAYEAALTVRTRETLPEDWAKTQNNLGLAYVERTLGDRAGNLEKAIATYKAALTVRTREALPMEWATTQNNLGTAYSSRILGDHAENLENAIIAYKAALTVTTRKKLPAEWAQTQNNLGNAYADRIRGGRADNLEKAIAAYKAALAIRRREALPRSYLLTQRLLGEVLLKQHCWSEAGPVYAGARDGFLLLFGQGLDAAEARDLIIQSGPLFAEAAYAAAERGETETALSLASEGRAHLMAVALRLNTLGLSSTKGEKLQDLRSDIAALERSAETAEGFDRTAALDRLAELRQQLLAIVKEATASESQPGSVMAIARTLTAGGGAVVVPIVTDIGSKVVVVAGGKAGATISASDLPGLTTQQLDELIRGSRNDKKGDGGWLRAFAIQELQDPDEKTRRLPEWIRAIDTIGVRQWQLFAGAIEKELQRRGVEPGARIVILPTGALGLLPLSLAENPVTGRRFGETYEIVEAPNLEALTVALKTAAEPPPPSLAAIINPTGEIPHLALPFTETEGALVAAHFSHASATILDKTSATPETVLNALKNKSYWHFSSHGFFDWSDARRSGLLMKGEQPLTLGTLADAQGTLGRPRLVVLSACETGLYETSRTPDEFVGLPATFMILGAAGVVSSLWQVDDMATALLMAKFYDYHLSDGLSPPAALKAAQSWLRNATKADLIAFADSAEHAGQLSAVKAAELNNMLHSRSRMAKSRFAAAWDLLHPRTPGARGSDSPPPASDAESSMRPFSHPYYWGAFFYTGL